MNQTKCQHILERIITNHLTTMETTKDTTYKIWLFHWTMKYMKLASHRNMHPYQGDNMYRLFQISNELDKTNKKWRIVSYKWKTKN